MWCISSSTWYKYTITPLFFHYHHHEISLYWSNQPNHCFLGFGPIHSSNIPFYWCPPLYQQQNSLKTSPKPCQVIWWSPLTHNSHWYATCHLTDWYWKGWKCCPGHQSSPGCQEHINLSTNYLLHRLHNQISSSTHSSVVRGHIEFQGLPKGRQWVKARRSWDPTVIKRETAVSWGLLGQPRADSF